NAKAAPSGLAIQKNVERWTGIGSAACYGLLFEPPPLEKEGGGGFFISKIPLHPPFPKGEIRLRLQAIDARRFKVPVRRVNTLTERPGLQDGFFISSKSDRHRKHPESTRLSRRRLVMGIDAQHAG
ncbi:MAG: hypothetical protein ACRETO_03810, partial [Gammaproteobacteria bacterium]